MAEVVGAMIEPPVTVRQDVHNIFQSINRPRLFPHGTTSIEQEVLEPLRRFESEPSSWRSEIESSVRAALDRHFPTAGPSLAANALRDRTWLSNGGSSWESFQASRIAELFNAASSGAGKLAARMIDLLRSSMPSLARTETNPSPAEEEAKPEPLHDETFSEESEVDSSTCTPSESETDPLLSENDEAASTNPSSGAAINTGNATATGAEANASASATGAAINTGNAHASGAEANASASATGAAINTGNANATGAEANATASATGAAINTGNAHASGASASASARATGFEANLGNVSASGPSASVDAHAHGFSANVGNVSVAPASASLTADVGLGVNAFNVNVSPGSVSAGVTFGQLSFGNVSVGGLSFVLDLNPLNIFNIGTGGASAGGGSSGGGGESEGAAGSSGGGSQGSAAGTGLGDAAGSGGATGRPGSSGGSGGGGDSAAGSGGTTGRGNALTRAQSTLEQLFPNIHFDLKGKGLGNKFENGRMVSFAEINEGPNCNVERNAQWPRTNPESPDEAPDPFHIPRTPEERERIFREIHKASNDDACTDWARILAGQTDGVAGLSGVTFDNFPHALDLHLSQPGSALIVTINGAGDHAFAVTGHGDRVVITDSWVNARPIQNRELSRADFLRNMRVLGSSSTEAQRVDALRTLFNVDGDAIRVMRNHQARLQITGAFVRQLPTDRAPGINANPQRARGVPTRPPTVNHRFVRSNHTGDDPANSDRNNLSAEEQEALSLVQEFLVATGLPPQDLNELLRQTRNSDDDETNQEERQRELCGHCRPKGRPCCLPCLNSGKGLRTGHVNGKGSNIHGFHH
jgi:hypothetical protein